MFTLSHKNKHNVSGQHPSVAFRFGSSSCSMSVGGFVLSIVNITYRYVLTAALL